MPLRDHFRSPVNDFRSWDSLHGGWPMVIVLRLNPHLPSAYSAGPNIHLGRGLEIDVAAFDDNFPSPFGPATDGADGGVAVFAPATPTLVAETEIDSPDEYEVRIYDTTRHRHLVAAIEIVSPSNKDRPTSRADFVGKCINMLRHGVCVGIVDLVTIHHFNLYQEVLDAFDRDDPSMGDPPTHIYAATMRLTRRGGVGYLESWAQPLALGGTLPTLPIWLTAAKAIPLELEPTYEDTCRALRIV